MNNSTSILCQKKRTEIVHQFCTHSVIFSSINIIIGRTINDKIEVMRRKKTLHNRFVSNVKIIMDAIGRSVAKKTAKFLPELSRSACDNNLFL